uniref:Dynein light intermediate chain n=1 Tax=Panagrolaimus sp. PS1159 TaxID=55785 RepID=A0AC35FM07_9BILA
MATKNNSLFSKKQSFANDTDNVSQYSNLKLNQNYKCSILTSDRSCKKSYFKTSKISNLSILSDKIEKETKKCWKNNSLNSINKSTLSLHISAYENSFDSDIFGRKKNEDLIKKQEKQSFTVASLFAFQNPFEFSRQQNDQIPKPEVSHFKASQRLHNPNKTSKNVKRDSRNMATATHYPVAGPMMQAPPKEEEENSWTQMLAEIGSKPASNIQKGSVVFLGDEFCGKTSLLQRMTKNKRQSFSSALEYSFLNIQSDYKDDPYAYQLGSSGAAAFGPSDYVNLPVYLLNGRIGFAPLLKFAFPKHLSKCCIVLMASLLPPENIIPSLEEWYKVIEEKIYETYDEKEIQAGKQAQIRFWQEYVEPLDTSMHNEHNSVKMDLTLLPPEPNVLTHNCGAPVVVVLSKCDQYNEFTDEQLNRIQYHVRNFCISRGAALFYTSTKDDLEPDSVFIPSGWDSIQKLEIVKETLSDLSLPQPTNEEIHGGTSKESIVSADEDEQTFLARLHKLLNEPIKAEPKREPVNASPKREPTIETKHSLTPQAASVAAPQDDAASPILSFFSNLMKNQKKSSTSATSTVDPSTHFQKILNNSKLKKASTTGLCGDQLPRTGLTANSSASALFDQDTDDNESIKSGDLSSTPTTDYGNESQPNSAHD